MKIITNKIAVYLYLIGFFVAFSFLITKMEIPLGSSTITLLSTAAFFIILIFSSYLYSFKKSSQAADSKMDNRGFQPTKMAELLDQSPLSIILTDLEGTILDINKKMIELSGYTKDQLIGKNPRVLKSGKTDEKQYSELWETITKGKIWTGEFCNRNFNGNEYIEKARITPIKDSEGNIYQYLGVKEDITDFKKNQEIINRQNEIIKLLLQDFEENSLSWMMEVDSNLQFQYISSKLNQYLGHKDLIGLSVFEYIHGLLPENDSEADDLFVDFISNLRQWKSFKNKNLKVLIQDSVHWLSISATTYTIPSTNEKAWRGIGHDITEQRDLKSKLLKRANYDEHTDLPNRRLFRELLTNKIETMDKERKCLLGFIEIKGLEKIRSIFGSDARNSLIELFITQFKQHLGNGPVLAKFDGYEFAFSAEIFNIFLIEKIHNFAREMNKPLSLDSNTYQLEINIGIAQYPDDAPEVKSLFHAADLALNSAILSDKRKVMRYQKDLSFLFLQRQALVSDFYPALLSKQFHLLYQPQIDAKTKAIIGAEALVRWNHPSIGNISPETFIPLAEDNSFIIKLGEWILQKACSDAMNWDNDIKISVNVSTKQLLDTRSFIQIVKNTLNETNLSPVRLILEITESAMFKGENEISQLLKELREMGISVALDDFGTGYSSLAYLQKLNIDELKIDQAFVRALGVESNAESIVKTIIDLADSMGLTTIAEGVETEEQALFLQQKGCLWFQGYLYGKPMSDELFRRKIES